MILLKVVAFFLYAVVMYLLIKYFPVGALVVAFVVFWQIATGEILTQSRSITRKAFREERKRDV